MTNQEILLTIILQENAVFEVFENYRSVAQGNSLEEAKQHAMQAMVQEHGANCEVSFRFSSVGKRYQELYAKAINIMLEKHRGQVDRGGMPYYGHLIRVSRNVLAGKQKIVALLHDTIEDTDVTAEYLLEQGFPEEIVAAVVAISRREGESYEDFIDRVAANPLARVVKLADLKDNLNVLRLPEVTEQDRQHLNRYLKAWRKLSKLDGLDSQKTVI